VVRTAELGDGIGLEIEDPVKSMHAVALDPGCRHPIPLRDGRRFTAVEIQFEYLAAVEKRLADLPDWAPEVCRRWRIVLSCLAEDPLLLARRLDWPIKYGIWKRLVEKIDLAADGKDLLADLRAAAGGTAYEGDAVSLEQLLGPSSPVLPKVAELNMRLRRRGLRWDQLKSSADDRARLSEILDVRFGILGEGIFDTMDRQGVLAHRILPEGSVAQAMKEAPPGTRARLRSQAIRDLAGRASAACSWEAVVDKERGFLNLGDPRQQSACWQAPPPPKPATT
jgi:hypothetical protein